MEMDTQNCTVEISPSGKITTIHMKFGNRTIFEPNVFNERFTMKRFKKVKNKRLE